MLSNKCSITRHNVVVGTDDGTPITQDIIIGENIPCLVDYCYPREYQTDSKVKIYIDTYIYLPKNTDIISGDTVTVDSFNYIAQSPAVIAHHHLEVALSRKDNR